MTTNNSDRHSPGFWMNLFNSLRVAWRLMWDSRVPFSAKLVPHSDGPVHPVSH